MYIRHFNHLNFYGTSPMVNLYNPRFNLNTGKCKENEERKIFH